MKFRDFFDEDTKKWNVKEVKDHFTDLCNARGIWTDRNPGCETYGLHLSLIRYGYHNDEGDVTFKIESPRFGNLGLYYNEKDLRVNPNRDQSKMLDADFDDYVNKCLDHSIMCNEEMRYPDSEEALNYMLMERNPEPEKHFTADEKALWKQLKLVFASDTCKFINFADQYDLFGEELFDTWNRSDTELCIGMNDSDDDSATFAFDRDLNFTAKASNGATGKGKGYADAAKWYVVNVANKIATGEYAKDYNPKTYQLIVYLNQDFYTKVSKNIWQPIERMLEDSGRLYTNYSPEDWVDDRAAAWVCVEEEDVKEVVDWLRKRKVKNPIRFEIIDKDTNEDVTDQF